MSFTFSKNDTSPLDVFIRLINEANSNKGIREIKADEFYDWVSVPIEGDSTYRKLYLYLTAAKRDNSYRDSDLIVLKYKPLDLNIALKDYQAELVTFKQNISTLFNLEDGSYVDHTNKFRNTIENSFYNLTKAFKYLIPDEEYKDQWKYNDFEGSSTGLNYVLNDAERTITIKAFSGIFADFVVPYPTKDDLYKTNLDGLLLDQYSEE